MPRTTQDEDKDTKSFPKFSSFKKNSSDNNRSTNRRETDLSIARKRKRHNTHSRDVSDGEYGRHRHRGDHYSGDNGRNPTDLSVDTKSKPSSSARLQSTPVINDLYEIDTNGDKRNAFYDSSYKYDVPTFYRYGSGRIIGGGLRLQITSESEFSVVIEPYNPKKVSSRDMAFYRRRFVYGLPQDRVESPNITGGNLILPEADFVPCEDSKAIADPETEEYFGISKKRDEMNAYEKENVDLMKRVSENPKDTVAWISLIKIQPLVISLEVRKQERNELILSICEKAWKANPDNAELALLYMRHGAQVWTPDKCSKEWIDVISASPHNVELYLEFLQHYISNRGGFTFDAACRKIEETMTKIEWIITHKDSKAESVIPSVILLAGMFFRECGYTEMAIGLAQALIELNYFAPVPTTSREPSTVYRYMSAFRSFWDKEFPRVGEVGSKGWRNTNDNSIFEPEHTSEPTRYQKSTGKDWIDKEIEQSNSDGLPVRTLSYGNDPYRVVLFDDIEKLLYVCQSPEIKDQLLYVCLILCGFPFNSLHYFSAYDVWAFASEHRTSPSYDPRIPLDFQRRLCDLLLKEANLTEKDCINPLLDWAFTADNDNGLKLTKELLSVRRSDFVLWSKYIIYEWQTSPDAARKTAAQCLRLLKGTTNSLIISDVSVELEFLSQSEINTDYLLSKLKSSIETAGTTIENYNENPYETLASKICREAILSDLTAAITHSGILWDYLRARAEGQLQLMILKPFWTTLLDDFETTVQDMRPLKDLLVNISNIFMHHMKISAVRNMGEFRHFLTRCIRLFPSEDTFLQYYVANEERNKFDNQVRMTLDRYVLDGPSVTLGDWKFAIDYERSTSGSSNMIRAIFERATENQRTRLCPTLWKSFIEFELLENNDAIQSKMAFYKAVRICPWSKDIILLPFSLLRDIMGPIELRSMAEILLERQIRVRIPLPDNEFIPAQEDKLALPYDSDSQNDS